MEGNDHQIVRAVLAGDKDAYGALVVRHSQNVFRVAFRITGDEADADEVVQEAFMRGYQRLVSFESRSEFGTWIYRIAVNCALNMVSKRKSGTSYQIAEDADPSQQQVQVADRSAGPERTLLSREIEALQVTAMRGLTATERTAFILRHLEDRSTTEIAEALSIAPNAAKQAVFRAVQKLRRSLAPLQGDPMNHFNEEELIDYHYGESPSPEAVAHHLRECPDCARNYAALMRDLAEIAVPATPVRPAEYGQQVWDGIRGSLRAYPAPEKKRWFSLAPGNQWKGFAAVAACLLVIAAAFFAGRQWEHRNPQQLVANNASRNQGKQKVVLLVLGDHLDRSERLLVELKHAEPSTEGPMQAEARDLLAANRLYRESVKSSDPTLANALDHLERVLIEVSNEPVGLSQARLDELQKEMNTDGLLFEVRVLRSRVRGDAQSDVEQKQSTSAATKGVSI